MTEITIDVPAFTFQIGIISAISTAATYVIVHKAKEDLCEDIKKYRAFMAEELNKIKVRLGIIEIIHQEEDTCS